MGENRYWLETLGCPKNQVDSDKLEGKLAAEGFVPAGAPDQADLLVVNTCAFIEAARQESIEAVLDLAGQRQEGARLVVTGCMAERYGDELAAELPEVDLVAGFGTSLTAPLPTHGASSRGDSVRAHGASSRGDSVRVSLRDKNSGGSSFDLLELPRPAARAPWAYLKVAEGCDRTCGFCAIPSFRGRQRSRQAADLIAEAERLATGDGNTPGVKEIVLVAQDLASYGRDRHLARLGNGDENVKGGSGSSLPLVDLVSSISDLVARTRLLYLYPSSLTDELSEAIIQTGVGYFDLSLQHVSRPLLARMRRWGDGNRFMRRIERIRRLDSTATFRSSFILGYPGETEEDHDLLLEFLGSAELDWAGFFLFSSEEGTYAADLPDQVPAGLALERMLECTELQDAITARRRDLLVGARRQVLIDQVGQGRTIHEAPEIDGIVHVPKNLEVGELLEMEITAAWGTDLQAEPASRHSTSEDNGHQPVGPESFIGAGVK